MLDLTQGYLYIPEGTNQTYLAGIVSYNTQTNLYSISIRGLSTTIKVEEDKLNDNTIDANGIDFTKQYYADFEIENNEVETHLCTIIYYDSDTKKYAISPSGISAVVKKDYTELTEA